MAGYANDRPRRQRVMDCGGEKYHSTVHRPFPNGCCLKAFLLLFLTATTFSLNVYDALGQEERDPPGKRSWREALDIYLPEPWQSTPYSVRTVWRDYGWELGIVLLLCAGEGILILALWRQLVSRRRAEHRLRESDERKSPKTISGLQDGRVFCSASARTSP
jgi:hypothetical protein